MLHCFIDCHTSYVTKRKTSSILGGAKYKRKCFDSISTVQRKSKGLKSDVTLHLSYDNQSSLWGWGPPGDNLVFRQISVYQLSAICIRLGRGGLWTLVL